MKFTRGKKIHFSFIYQRCDPMAMGGLLKARLTESKQKLVPISVKPFVVGKDKYWLLKRFYHDT